MFFLSFSLSRKTTGISIQFLVLGSSFQLQLGEAPISQQLNSCPSKLRKIYPIPVQPTPSHPQVMFRIIFIKTFNHLNEARSTKTTNLERLQEQDFYAIPPFPHQQF